MPKTHDEKIADVKEQLRQLKNKEKILLNQQKDQERKARTSRLIQRGAITESLIDGADILTNEQFQTLMKAALSATAVCEMAKTMCEQNAAEVVIIADATANETPGNPQEQAE